MSHGSPKKWMEGSDYKDKCSQWADDVGGMSNHEKGKISPRKEKNRGELQYLHALQKVCHLEQVLKLSEDAIC